MNASQVRKAEKLSREDAFIAENAADFPANSPVAQLTAEINAERQKILQYDAAQTSGFDDKRQAQEIYDDRRDRLIDLLDEFALAAAIVDDDMEGTAAKFKNSYPRTDPKIIARAASFYNDSADIEAALIEAGLDADARERLQTLRDEFQQAAASHDRAETGHAEASGGMLESFRKATALASRRDKRIRMKYRNNPAKLAAWTVASHLERAPRRKNDGDAETPGAN